MARVCTGYRSAAAYRPDEEDSVRLGPYAFPPGMALCNANERQAQERKHYRISGRAW
jgi:hypothetical protein